MIETFPPALAAWLASARNAMIVDAYTLITATGVTARWLDVDFDFTVPDALPRAFERGPVFDRGQLRQTIGLSVDDLSLNMMPVYKAAPVMLGAQTLLQAAQNGLLRGATLQLERLVFDSALAPGGYQGRWVEFAGTLAVKSTAGGRISAEVLSELNLLDTPMPRDVFQAQCKNQVFDSNCGLSRAVWQVSGAVSAAGLGSANRSGFGTALWQAAGWFDQGTVQFTTGANAGIKRTVKSFLGGAFSFALPWPGVVAVADAFVALPGCNRSLTTGGCAKFNNRARYRGEPFIPQPETVN
jgi:uncharacterized phage protein (TIGR02218 family)